MSLNHCEFQLLNTAKHGLIGRLYNRKNSFNTAKSTRTILHVASKGRVIFFKTTAEDLLFLAANTSPSNMPANRVRTNQLLMQVRQRKLDPTYTPPIAVAVAEQLALPPAGETSAATCAVAVAAPPVPETDDLYEEMLPDDAAIAAVEEHIAQTNEEEQSVVTPTLAELLKSRSLNELRTISAAYDIEPGKLRKNKLITAILVATNANQDLEDALLDVL